MVALSLFSNSTPQELATGKPTEQSSAYAPKPKLRPDGEVDAEAAALPKTYSFHTQREFCPWWKVDLEAPYEISNMALFNRLDLPGRLKFFTILFSLDGEEWEPAFRKDDGKVFGGVDGNPLKIQLEPGYCARYIMVRLDGYDFLHFDRLEVYGKPANKKAMLRKRNIPHEVPTVLLDGVTLKVHADLYSDVMKKALISGGYERRERGLLPRAVIPGDRVLEIGSATGMMAMLAAKIVGVENVITFEGNPQMVEHAKMNFALNGLEGIRIENAILQNVTRWKADEKAEFHVARHFWASRLAPHVGAKPAADVINVFQVPTLCLETVIRESNANVLICDIEGGEIDLLVDADLSRIETIMMETHYNFVGAVATNKLIKRLVNKGFSIDLGASAQGVVLFNRGFELKAIPAVADTEPAAV